MQEGGGVPTDAISINHQLPWFERLFVIYLAIVLVFAFSRFIRLAWRLWIFSPPKHQVTDGLPNAADLVAANALANKLPKLQSAWSEDVEGARCRFEYLWATSVAKVEATKNIAVLTLILSGLVSAEELMENFRWIATVKSYSSALVAGVLTETLQIVLLGLTVSATLYFLSSFYAGVLAQRRASWHLFIAERKNGALESKE